MVGSDDEGWGGASLVGSDDRTRLGPEPDAVLQRIVRRCASALSVPTVALTILDDVRQTFVAEVGLDEDLARAGGTPIAWSFCRHVVSTGEALVVGDATRDPRFDDNPLVATRLVRAYAGVPVRDATGRAIGALCLLSAEPRAFGPAELGVLEVGAEAATQRLSVRSAERAGPLDPATGTVVDERWTLLAPLGAGGQGEVWSARERGTGRRVAVKLARRSLAVEARALGGVRHPNLVAVHAAGALPDGRSYLVLDAIDGQPMAEVIAGLGPGAEPFVRDRAREVAGALTSLHAAGIVHGDVKAANVLYDAANDRAVLVDLGLGLRLGEDGRSGGGTPGLSAPEQFEQGPLTAAADTYGLAALVYQWLVGSGPFLVDGEGAKARLARQVRGAPTPVADRRPELARLGPLLARALSPRPEERPATPLLFAAELAELLDGRAPGPSDTAASVWHAARAGSRSASPHAAERAWALLTEAEREALRWADLEPWVDTAALTAYLRGWSGGSADALVPLARAVGGHAARRLVRGNAVTFTAEAMTEALPGLLARLHPWARPAPAPGGASLVLPFDPEVWRPWIGGVLAGVFARAGLEAEVAWDRAGERHLLRVNASG